MATPVYLEVGTKKIFACSFDWPGWARAATTEEDALEALAAYAERYRPVPETAGQLSSGSGLLSAVMLYSPS